MRLDIIIVNYNSTDHLLNCLESLQKALNGLDARIFVQDNASTDGVERIMKRYHPTVPSFPNYPSMRCIPMAVKELGNVIGRLAAVVPPRDR